MATAPTQTEVGHGAGEAHSAGFPPFDSSTFASQLVWLALTFGVFYWLLTTKILPNIDGILTARSDRMGRDLAEAQRLKGETDAAIAGYDKSLAEARARAQGIATETRTALNVTMEGKRAAAEAGLATKLAEAEARIAGIKTRAMDEVGAIATDTAEAVVAALAKVSASREDVAAAVSAAMSR